MAKNNVFKRWKRRSLKFKIITTVSLILAFTIIPYFLLAVFVMFVSKTDFIGALHSGLLYGLWGVVLLGILLFALFEYRTLGSRRVMKVNKELEDSHFMSEKEIERNEGFTVTPFSELQNVEDGIMIMAERSHNRMNVVLLNPIHTLVIATTGTGKTTTYIEPSIEILSRTATKPCMVVTDPKGELYIKHANSLKNNGYNVHIIDLTDTYHSTLWNPFNDVWKKTAKISEPITQEKNKYAWGGSVYETYADAEQSKKEFTVRLNDEIFQDLQDIIYTAFMVEPNQQDKTWQQGARDLIFGLTLRMWEDLRDGYMPKEKFNLYNLWWNLTEYAKPDPESGQCEVLNRYIVECADEVSRAPGQANTVLVSQDRTLTSYLGSVNQYLHWLADGGVTQLTSGNEIEFSEWDEQPNVLFIKIPDLKKGRHGLVTLMLMQLYKALDEKGEKNRELKETSDKCLKRHCYFLMDEFGSLPMIKDFDNIVKIARSLGVFMVPVLQDYAQLDKVYGKEAATTIKNNCNIKVFLGTNDDKTRNEISEACGKHKVKSVSYSENKDMSVSTSAQSVPLIFPSELKNLNDPKNGIYGNAVILVSGTYPIKSNTTPCFKAQDIYGISDNDSPPMKEFMIFDEEENRYDITKLIFLHENLDFDEEVASANNEQQNDSLIYDIADAKPRKKSIDLLPEQVAAEIEKLRGKISDEDYQLLKIATLSEKIQLLDAIAEKATQESKLILAMQIESVLGLLKTNKNIFDDLSPRSAENY